MGWFTTLIKETAPSLIGTAVSAYVAKGAADDARKATQQATNAAIAEQRRVESQTRADTAEQRALLDWATKRLKGMSTGGFDVSSIPGYQFRLDEGLKAIERARSAGGTLASGRTMKEMGRYASDYAASEFNNEWNRIAQLANIGAGGQAAVINSRSNAGGNVANLLIGQGGTNATIAGSRNASLQGSIQNVVDAFNRSSLLKRL